MSAHDIRGYSAESTSGVRNVELTEKDIDTMRRYEAFDYERYPSKLKIGVYAVILSMVSIIFGAVITTGTKQCFDPEKLTSVDGTKWKGR